MLWYLYEGKRERNDRMGWRGVFRGWLDIYYLPLLKGDLPQENSIYMYISKYVFKFSAVSFFKTHLTDYFYVLVFNNDFCGVPKMLLLCCRLFWGQQTGCGGRQRTAHPESPGAVKGLSQGKDEVDVAPTSPTITLRNFSNTNERSLCLCLPVFPMCFSLSHFLPELHTKPEWASAAPPVFKHLARSLVSSFLQLIQEADKYC